MDRFLSSNVIYPLFPRGCLIRHIPHKRIFDILFSSAVILLGAPLFVIIAIAIRMTSPGSVLYSHERIGRGGKPFRCYKFRSMHKDADKRLERLLASDDALREEWKASFKLKNDPRITSLGGFLRKTSLDELPQFFNVLRGDMSIVGPRPLVQEEIVYYFGDKAHKILMIRPGLTGIWQTSGRNDTTYGKRIELEEEYIDSHSLPLDIILIGKTVSSIFLRKGAY